MHGLQDGQLQQRSREALPQGQDEGRLLPEKLLHGILQPQVKTPVALHKVRQVTAQLQELLHLGGRGHQLSDQSWCFSFRDGARTCHSTTRCQQRAMPAMLLLLFPLGLANEDEDGEVAFLASFPSDKKELLSYCLQEEDWISFFDTFYSLV